MAHIYRICLLTMLLVAPAPQTQAQEPSAPSTENDSATTGDRIVEGRPALYSFKRAIHPLTWVEALPEPAFRSAENGWINRLITRKPDKDKVSGVRFGLDGPGTGSGLGPIVTFFHKDLLGKGIDIEIPINYTFSRYELYQFNASVPVVRKGFVNRLSLDLGTAYGSRPFDGFFGIGNDSPRRGDTFVRTVSRTASAGLTVRLNDVWRSGFHAAYRDIGVTTPSRGHSAQQTFTEDAAPGLFTGAILHSEAFTIGRNTEKREAYAFKGAADQLEISRNESAGKGDFAYWKYRLNVEHFFPLNGDGRSLIAARGFAETNQSIDGRPIPFFDMPWLGSSGTLRGFDNFRFRDKNAMVAGVEYRYRIWPAMDWGFFLDKGKVAPQFRDLTLNHLHTGYGARLFVWLKPDLPVSVDYSRSRETWRLYINANTTF